MRKNKKNLDLAILLVYPIIAIIISYIFHANAFWSVIVFLAAPAIYLSIRDPRYVKKSAFFSLVLTLAVMVFIDYIAQTTGQWIIPHSIVGYRLFGIVTLEVILWAYFVMYFTVVFYEYFLDHHLTHKLYRPKMKYLIMFGLILSIIFLTFLFASPNLLKIPYFYFLFGIMLILIPLIIELVKKPNLTAKFFLTGAYFFYLTFCYEITALKLGWWYFPEDSKFIGWVNIFNTSFPIEELFFWCILLAMATLSYYEHFDDEK